MIETIQFSQQDVAEQLLWPLWRCISEDYKVRYKREIWDHFENAVRAASYTGRLRTYLANFQKRIPCTMQAQYTKSIVSVVESNQDETILNWLRSETTYLIMLVRLRNQERKETLDNSSPSFGEFSPAGMELDSDYSDLMNKSTQD